MSVETDFEKWLIKKLESLEIDDEILGSYISSIVTSDDPYAEKKATLKDILLGFTLQNVDIDNICSEVLEKWSEQLVKPVLLEETKSKNDVAVKVAMIMEKQAQPVLKVVNRSSEEEKLREAILLSSALEVSEDEDDFEDEDSSFTTQNQNVDAVLQAEKDKREKLKAEAEKKKAQDKANLEKQRQKQEEKKKKGMKTDTEKKGKTMKKGYRR